MKRFAGLDVSLATTAIWVVDEQGQVVFEGSVTTDPDAIAAALAPHAPDLVGLEAGPMSEWLHTGLSGHGLETVLMETRHVRAALKASLVKTDRRDACGIAHLPADGLVPAGAREDVFRPRAARPSRGPRCPGPADARSR